MKRGTPAILLLTVLLASIALVFGRNEVGMRNFPFSVIVTADGVREELRCVKFQGEYYMFLPSYGDHATEQICVNAVYDVFIDGQKLRKNQPCTDFPTNTKLELYFRSLNKEGYETITFVRSANMTTTYIDLPSGNMEYIHEQKGNAEAGWMRIYREDGTLDYSGALETIKARGNATWVAEKKSYSLKLNQEADLLGMGAADRWVLLSNSYDSSNIRNKLAYDMAIAANMPFSPECTWTDLYLNGEYVGLYLLSERNEVHSQRVDIDPGSSFLVAIEPDWRLQQQGYAYVQTEGGTAFRIHHSAMPEDTLLGIWQSAENAMFAEDGYDTVTGKQWDELIDVDSWAKKYLLEEVLSNTDVGLASEFFYYEASDGVIYAGPVWDMDVTLRSDDTAPWMADRALIAGRPHLTGIRDRHYFYALLQKPAFRERVVELYQAEFRPLLCRLLETGLETYTEKTIHAALANQTRWDGRDPLEKAAELAENIQKRMDFLDAYWIRQDPFFLVQVLQSDRVWAFAVSPGETLEMLQDPEEGTWCLADTEEVLDRTAPVEGDLVIFVKSH